MPFNTIFFIAIYLLVTNVQRIMSTRQNKTLDFAKHGNGWMFSIKQKSHVWLWLLANLLVSLSHILTQLVTSRSFVIQIE